MPHTSDSPTSTAAPASLIDSRRAAWRLLVTLGLVVLGNSSMYVVSVVERPQRLLQELHRVCKPDGEIFLVNHVRSDNPIIGAVEKGLARFSDKLGFHPDFELRELLDPSHEISEVSRINFFWKVMRVRNGVAHRRFSG